MIYSSSFNHLTQNEIKDIINFFNNKKRDSILEVFPFAGSLSIELSQYFDKVSCIVNTNELYSPSLKDHIKINNIFNIISIKTTDNIKTFYEIVSDYNYIYCHDLSKIDIKLLTEKITSDGGLFVLYKDFESNKISKMHIKKIKEEVIEEEVIEEEKIENDQNIIEETDDSETNNNSSENNRTKKRRSRKTNK